VPCQFTKNGGNWFVQTHARLKGDSGQSMTLHAGHAIMLDRPEDLLALLLAEAAK